MRAAEGTVNTHVCVVFEVGNISANLPRYTLDYSLIIGYRKEGTNLTHRAFVHALALSMFVYGTLFQSKNIFLSSSSSSI